MKKITFVLTFSLFIGSIFAQKANDATVTLSMPSITTNAVWAASEKGQTVINKTPVNGKYQFRFKDDLPALFTIGIDSPKKGQVYLFLEKGDNLEITTDFDRHTLFAGMGKENSRILNEGMMRYLAGYKKLDAKKSSYSEILGQWTGLLQQIIDTIKASKAILTPAFYNNELISFQYQKRSTAVTVASVYQLASDTSIKRTLPQVLTEQFWDLVKGVQFDDKLLAITDYKNFMAYIYPKILRWQELKNTGKLGDTTATKDEIAMQEYRIIEKKYPGKIRSTAMQLRLDNILSSVKDAKKVRPLLDEFLTKYASPEQVKELNDKYNKMTSLSTGQVPPAFVMYDLDGKAVSLKDFAGKVIYMDLWASWCSPCRGEMKNGSPALHEKFKDNKDVVFLYISIDDNELKWKDAIKEDKIQGVHALSVGGVNSSVAKAFGVSGIPRYIIIGKDGKIFDNDATRPSQLETVNTLNKALKE